MRQKGFILLPIIIILLLGVVGYLIYQNSQLRINSEQQKVLSPAIVPTMTSENTPPANTINTDNWKTYTSKLYLYSIHYPSDWQVKDTEHSAKSIFDGSSNKLMTDISNNGSKISIFYEGDFDHGFDPWVFKSKETVNIGDKTATKTILTLEGNEGEWIIYTIDKFNDFRIEASVTGGDEETVNQILSTLKFSK